MNQFPNMAGTAGSSYARAIRRGSAVLSLAAVALFAFVTPAMAEVWKDRTGQFQVEAEFLGIRGTDVYLKKPNGVTIKVPLDRLSAESQQRARQLAMPPAPAAPAVPRRRVAPTRPTKPREPWRQVWRRATCARSGMRCRPATKATSMI